MNPISRALRLTHKYWSRLVPGFYHAYALPTGGRVYIDITESPMMFDRITGRYEPNKHRALEFFLGPGDAYIDIGANKGEFAIQAALLVGESGNVVAFEPEAENCAWIRKSIAKSGLDTIVLEEAAVGAEDGYLTLYLGAKSGHHTLLSGADGGERSSVPVRVFSLDTYLQEHQLPNLKAIKIDVEGFEKEVLLGAHQTLSTQDVILFIDIHASRGIDPGEVYEILDGYGYALFNELYPFDMPIDRALKPTAIVAMKKK